MIKLIVMDVDGTLTDGSIYYNDNGIETKKFNVKDAAGILSAQALGKECMLLTGRRSMAVEMRAKDLGIRYVCQGVNNKELFLENFIYEHNVNKMEILYIGDDLNDVKAMKLAGFVGCPADAAIEVIDMADYVSVYNGGCGAVRDVIFRFLKEEGTYQEAISKAYGDMGIMKGEVGDVL